MKPPKPRTIWRDIKSFFSRGERHNWIALVMAILIPGLLLGTFVTGIGANLLPTEPPITYAYVWEEGRTDEEIIDRQRELALAENERRAVRRAAMQELAEASGVEYDREAAAEADRITEENRRRLSGETAESEDAPTEAETDTP